jgi:hypothetical protein
MGVSEEGLRHLRQFVIDKVGKLAEAELRRKGALCMAVRCL